MSEPIPPQYVEQACRAFYDAAGVHWDTLGEWDRECATTCITAALESFLAAAAPDMIAAAKYYAGEAT